jgi:subtilisin family serine protease
VVPGEFLVKFRGPVSATFAANTMAAASFRLKHSYRTVPGLQRAVIAPGADPRAMAALLARQPGVEYVEPNFTAHAMAMPNDPDFHFQWGLHNVGQNGGTSTANPDIGALAAWDITTGSKQVVVAVIDTGVDYNHEDLAANIFVNAAAMAWTTTAMATRMIATASMPSPAAATRWMIFSTARMSRASSAPKATMASASRA